MAIAAFDQLGANLLSQIDVYIALNDVIPYLVFLVQSKVRCLELEQKQGSCNLLVVFQCELIKKANTELVPQFSFQSIEIFLSSFIADQRSFEPIVHPRQTFGLVTE